MDSFNNALKTFKKNVEGDKVMVNFAQEATTIFEHRLNMFIVEAERYNQDVYNSCKKDLSLRMFAALYTIFLTQLRNLRKSCVELFENTITESLKLDDSDFASKVRIATEISEKMFLKIAQGHL